MHVFAKPPLAQVYFGAAHDPAPTQAWNTSVAHIEVPAQADRSAVVDTGPLVFCAGMWAHGMGPVLSYAHTQTQAEHGSHILTGHSTSPLDSVRK